MTKIPNVKSSDDLNAEQWQFIEWLATPSPFKEPETQKELAAQLDLHETTLSTWKRIPILQQEVARRRREVVELDALDRVISAMIVRASRTEANESWELKEARKNTELFLKWVTGADLSDGGSSVQFRNIQQQKQAQQNVDGLNKESEEQDREWAEVFAKELQRRGVIIEGASEN